MNLFPWGFNFSKIPLPKAKTNSFKLEVAYNDEYIQQSFQAILSKREYDALRSNSFGGI